MPPQELVSVEPLQEMPVRSSPEQLCKTADAATTLEGFQWFTCFFPTVFSLEAR